MLYANLSQQLHTIKTKYKVLHRQNHRNHPWKNYRLAAEDWNSPSVFSITLSRRFLKKERNETFKIKMFELLSLYKTNTMYIGFTNSTGTVKGYPIFY